MVFNETDRMPSSRNEPLLSHWLTLTCYLPASE
jgi:hypothetical protein